MARVTAEEAAQIINSDRKIGRQGRLLPPTLSIISRFMQDNVLHVCNVGPWAHALERPSLSVYVPGYNPEKDKEKAGYSKSAPFPVIHRFASIQDEDQMKWNEDEGRTVLLDLIGIGWGLPRNQALTRYGVFVPEGKFPVAHEIATANAALDQYADFLIDEARTAFDQGIKEWNHVKNPDGRHLWAARKKGINEKWVTNTHTAEAVRCKKCGRANSSEIAVCPCGMIINEQLYREITIEQNAIVERLGFPGQPRGKG
jgi:hypothetical protein